jgi:hypothetical protein
MAPKRLFGLGIAKAVNEINRGIDHHVFKETIPVPWICIEEMGSLGAIS